MFYFPDTLEILTRRIHYSHPSHESIKYITEELTFENRGNNVINEVILQIDNYRENLNILDKRNTNVVYLPKSEIMRRNNGCISEEIINKFERNEIYILWIILSEPLLPRHQEKLFMRYVQAAKMRRKQFIFLEAQYYDKISFYEKETISIFSSLEEGLTINTTPRPFVMTKNQQAIIFIGIDPSSINNIINNKSLHQLKKVCELCPSIAVNSM